MTSTIFIEKGREKPIIQQHPWVFSGAIARVEGSPLPGEIVTVRAHDSRFLARGYWNAKSQIQVRILTWQDASIDDDWWRAMLQRAINARTLQNRQQAEGNDRPIAYRLVNAENDFLPGLVVDRYGDYLVLQALTLAIDLRKKVLAQMLSEMLPVKGIFERSDIDVRGKEGLKPVVGTLWGQEPPALIPIFETAELLVDIRHGHKTGFYLDQADNRHLLVRLLQDAFEIEARPRHILNLFSYTGGFTVNAQTLPGVHAVNVDSSHEILEMAERIVEANIARGLIQPAESTAEHIQADVFDYLRDVGTQNQQFDVVILDPPKFAHNKQQVEKAARGYKDINLNAFRIIRPGGYLMTFSCSGAVSPDLFQKIVFGALADAERQAQVVAQLGAASDHPVALTFPEGEYLKGLLLRVY